jgi:inorganic pyrophosphatase
VVRKVLPLGTTFPYDFGFVAGTKAADGDPLDVLVVADEPLACVPVTGTPITTRSDDVGRPVVR